MVDISRGQAAKEILDNEIFAEAFVAIRNKIFEEWANSTPEEAPARQDLYLMSKLLTKLHQQLRAVMETGQIAEFNLKSTS